MGPPTPKGDWYGRLNDEVASYVRGKAGEVGAQREQADNYG